MLQPFPTPPLAPVAISAVRVSPVWLQRGCRRACQRPQQAREHPPAASKQRALDQVAGERPGSRWAGSNVNASAGNAKTSRPEGKENGFGKQGDESAWGGRGQAKPGLRLRGGKGKSLMETLQCWGHPQPHCISLDQLGCANSTGKRARALLGAGLGSLARRSGAGRARLAASTRMQAELGQESPEQGQCSQNRRWGVGAGAAACVWLFKKKRKPQIALVPWKHQDKQRSSPRTPQHRVWRSSR